MYWCGLPRKAAQISSTVRGCGGCCFLVRGMMYFSQAIQNAIIGNVAAMQKARRMSGASSLRGMIYTSVGGRHS